MMFCECGWLSYQIANGKSITSKCYLPIDHEGEHVFKPIPVVSNISIGVDDKIKLDESL